jgi:hypothetical protein
MEGKKIGKSKNRFSSALKIKVNIGAKPAAEAYLLNKKGLNNGK